MNNLSETIQRLVKTINDPNCARMNCSAVKGYLGELLIKKKLEDEGLNVKHHGNQSGFDLSFRHKGNDFSIDVKTSLLKNESNEPVNYWGWALLHENKKKEIKATHIVCLGCHQDCSPSFFIVIPIDIVPQFPNGMKQFSKVKHGLRIPEKRNHHKEDSFIRQCRSVMRANKIKIVDFKKSLKEKIKF